MASNMIGNRRPSVFVTAPIMSRAPGLNMQIRYGFHIELTLDQPTTLVTLMDIHPSRQGDVIRETPLQSSQTVPIETFIDGYGNVSRRLTAGAGGLALTLEGIVRDSGRQNHMRRAYDCTPVTLK